MTEKLWTKVDDYFADLLIGSDPELDRVLAATRTAGMPEIQVSPLMGRMLMIMAQAAGARRILEIGTLAGYSTIWLARALPAGGRLVTLEAVALHADVARENIARTGFGDAVEVQLGPASQSLKALIAAKAEPFDFIFIDADKAGYPAYLELALALSRPGTLIVADNVVREGEVVDAASPKVMVQGIRQFNELLVKSKRVTATAIQTVGEKGHDGFVLARVIA
jgi:predicted O-methyltransferase YrrM